MARDPAARPDALELVLALESALAALGTTARRGGAAVPTLVALVAVSVVLTLGLRGALRHDGGRGGPPAVVQDGARPVPVQAEPEPSRPSSPAATAAASSPPVEVVEGVRLELAPLAPGVQVTLDGSATLGAAPDALRGAVLVLRLEQDRGLWLHPVHDGLVAVRRCTAFVAVMTRLNGVVRCTDQQLAPLLARGWSRVEGTFLVLGRDETAWVVLARDVPAGPVDLDTQDDPRSEYFFGFW
jgi:hypothetical protein